LQHVRIERRGGLAGLPAEAAFEVAALTASQQRALAQLVKQPPAASSPGPDRFHYRIQAVTADGTATMFDVPEDAMPAALAALVKPALP
jgi:hypothetical protein